MHGAAAAGSAEVDAAAFRRARSRAAARAALVAAFARRVVLVVMGAAGDAGAGGVGEEEEEEEGRVRGHRGSLWAERAFSATLTVECEREHGACFCFNQFAAQPKPL